MTSQLIFFIYFLSSPDPKSEKKNPVNQLIKKIWPYGKQPQQLVVNPDHTHLLFLV